MSADTTWPVSLTRAPRLASLSEEAPDVLLRSEVDVGPPKLRRRFTGDRRKFTIELDFTRSEVLAFDSWFLNNSTGAGGGARSFSWKHPRLGTTADFRFLSVPTYRPRAPRGDGSEWWLVSFEVEMLPGTDSSITPPGGGNDPPGGGNWPMWATINPDEVSPLEESETVSSGTVFEADSVPPVLLIAILTTNYGLDSEDKGSEEDAFFSGSTSDVSTTSTQPTPETTMLTNEF